MKSEALKKIESKVKDIEKAKKAFQEQAKELLLEALDETIFSKYPDKIEYIAVTAYTPYFCDGDPCEYGLGEVVILFNGEEDEFDGYSKGNNNEVNANKILESASEIIYAVGGDTFQSVFGDHIKIHFKPGKKIEIEDYEHD